MRISDWSSDVCSSDVELMLEEMVRAWNLVVMDGDALLRAQLVDELLDRARRHDLIGAARDDDPRRGAGREEAEIIHVRRRRRSEERRVGKECGSTCRSSGSPYA